MRIPSIQQAQHYLAAAEENRPGPWGSHSRYVAKAARAIARAHPDLDDDAAYVLGLLHDIGRGCEVSDFKHIVDGYRMMADDGFDDAARICLTHSFPLGTLGCYAGKIDSPDEDVEFVRAYLTDNNLNDYDRLIQLCDGLCLPTGFCLMEKRLVDVVMRYGIRPHTLDTWRVRFQIKADFDAAIGRPIYDLLDGVVENTFS